MVNSPIRGQLLYICFISKPITFLDNGAKLCARVDKFPIINIFAGARKRSINFCFRSLNTVNIIDTRDISIETTGYALN